MVSVVALLVMEGLRVGVAGRGDGFDSFTSSIFILF
jgi:hypothetical protein